MKTSIGETFSISLELEEEKDIIELRKMLSVEVLPHVTPAVKGNLNAVGIYTVKQFQNAKIALILLKYVIHMLN